MRRLNVETAAEYFRAELGSSLRSSRAGLGSTIIPEPSSRAWLDLARVLARAQLKLELGLGSHLKGKPNSFLNNNIEPSGLNGLCPLNKARASMPLTALLRRESISQFFY